MFFFICSEQKYFNHSHSKEMICKVEPLSSPQDQLQLVIRQLEVQNKDLQMMLGRNCNNKEITSYLEKHRHHIATQIEKLKLLRVIYFFVSNLLLLEIESF